MERESVGRGDKGLSMFETGNSERSCPSERQYTLVNKVVSSGVSSAPAEAC